MGGGMYFWGVGAGSLMSLNVAHGLRLHQDAGVLLFMNREVLETKSVSRRIRKNYAEAYPDWYAAITRMPRAFGNEVRNCYIKDRSVVFTSNSPPPETYRLRKIERGCDWPVQPLPDRVAGIAISDRYALGHNPHSSATWEAPPNESFPCAIRWNLLHSNLLLNCPIGVHIGHGIDKTMLSQNTILECRIPIKDEGKATVDAGTLTKHYYQLQAERETDR